MLAAPYINDNPYRLLGIGSVATQAKLEQAADLADKTKQIGIPPASGLLQVFGAEMLPRCAEKVQAFRVDPMERTIYRLFWPFDYQRLPNFKGTMADLLGSDVLGPASSFRVLQLRFAIAWVKYLVQPTAQKVHDVLDTFDRLCKDEAFYAFLVELLLQDGDAAEQATDVGNRAPTIVLERMLFVFRRQAVQWWESGEIAEVTELVQILTQSGYDDEILAKILPDLITAGEQEADRLQTTIQTFPGWMPTQMPYQPAEVAKLRLLAQALSARVPEAQRWLHVVEDRVRQVTVAMRDPALDLANRQNQDEFAVQILAHIQTFPLPDDLANQIQQAATQMQNRIDARQTEIWRGITPIERGPSLTTYNGMGCMAYGRIPFAGDPDWYFTTYYFVIFFLPIFPIRRYLVADAPRGGRYFRASAPLTKFGRYHLGTSMVVATLLLLYATYAVQHEPASNYGTTSAPSTSRHSRYPTDTAGSSSLDSPVNDATSAERKRLEDESAQINTDLYRRQTSIDHRRPLLETTSKQLDADSKKVNRSSRAAVKAYNARVRAFNKTSKQFDADLVAYNKRIERVNQITKRLRELER
ncbi:MAG: hypothetical protein JWL77_4621 [Chthonomonadaceae bacterium]|nr:hypothetical protein [Chthonomonadaceae bacterium]